MRRRTVIKTPYPTEEMVAAEMGISKKRLRELRAILDEMATKRPSGMNARPIPNGDNKAARRRTERASGSLMLRNRSRADRKRTTNAAARKKK